MLVYEAIVTREQLLMSCKLCILVPSLTVSLYRSPVTMVDIRDAPKDRVEDTSMDRPAA